MYSVRPVVERMAQAVSNHILKPNSPILKDIIGQRVLDVGFLVESGKEATKEQETEYRIEHEMFSFISTNEIFLLRLDRQDLCFISQHERDATLYYHENLTLEAMADLEMQYFGVRTLPYRYLASEYPEYSNDLINGMIGKKITAVDLYRVIRKPRYIYNQHRYCILKLYFEDGTERLLGSRIADIDDKDLDYFIDIQYPEKLDKRIIHRVYEIR